MQTIISKIHITQHWDKERIVLDESSFTDANDDERFIFELQLIKQRHVTAFTKHLISQLSKKVKEELLVEVTKQVDANSHFFVRFDLDALLKNEWILTLGGRCLHVNMAVCAHPRRQEVAINVVEKYLNQNDE